MKIDEIIHVLIQAAFHEPDVQTTDLSSNVVIHNEENELIPIEIEKAAVECICSEWCLVIYPKKSEKKQENPLEKLLDCESLSSRILKMKNERKIVNYVILTNTSLQDLCDLVRENIKMGWITQGGPGQALMTTANPLYYQAMIKY